MRVKKVNIKYSLCDVKKKLKLIKNYKINHAILNLKMEYFLKKKKEILLFDLW